jgi:rod shape-determining protein MreD
MFWFQNLWMSLLVLILTVLPLPVFLIYFWPCLPVLFFFIINVYQERAIVNIWIWLIGLSLDLLQNSYLGYHVIALLVLNFFISQYRHRFLLSPIAQQVIFVMFGALIYSSINEAFDWHGNGYQFTLRIVAIVLATALQWPWIAIWQRNKRQNVYNRRII